MPPRNRRQPNTGNPANWAPGGAEQRIALGGLRGQPEPSRELPSEVCAGG